MKKNTLFATLALLGLTAFAVGGSVQAQGAADLEVGFNLPSAVQDGVVRILVPTAPDIANLGQTTGAWNAGVPVTDAFVVDPGTAPTVICPNNDGDFTFGTPATQVGDIYYNSRLNQELTLSQAQALTADATASADFVRYLGFLCPYTGPGAITGKFSTGNPGSFVSISNLVNPLQDPDDQLNEVVSIPGKIQLLENGYSTALVSGAAQDYLVSDKDVIIAALTEEVLVTAQVAGQITFKVVGVPAGTEKCGTPTDVASYPTLIDYGSPLVNTFVDAAQEIEVVSSAANGYAVTTYQNHNLSRGGRDICQDDGVLPDGTLNRDCIPNFNWEAGAASSSAAAWTDANSTGFGFTVANNAGNGAASSIFDNDNYSRFFNGGTNSLLIADSATTSEATSRGDVFDVCYRLSLDAQSNAGAYENGITYTITAAF